MTFLRGRWNYCTPMSFMPRVYWKCSSTGQPNDGIDDSRPAAMSRATMDHLDYLLWVSREGQGGPQKGRAAFSGSAGQRPQRAACIQRASNAVDLERRGGQLLHCQRSRADLTF